MDPSHFELLIVLAGDGILSAPDFAFPCSAGECWFLPANLGEYRFAPIDGSATLIRTYAPNLAALREELYQAGIAKTVVANVVFD